MNRHLLIFAALAIAVCFGREAVAQPGHTGMVLALAFSPDDRSLFMTHDHDVVQRNAADGRTLRTFRGHLTVITSLAISSDGKVLLTSSEDGAVKLWDIATGRVTRELAKGKPGKYSYNLSINAVAISPDNRFAAWGDNAGDLTLWDVSAAKKLRTLHEEPRAGIDCVAFSPRGDSLLTAGGSGKVVRWDLKTGREILSFVDDPITGIQSMSVSTDGRKVLTASGLKIRLWDAATGKELLAFSGIDEGYYTPRCAAFTPDSAHAISGDDSRVIVWDLKDGRNLKTLDEPPFSQVESLAVSHNGELVAAGDIFGKVRLWRYGTGEPLWPNDRRGVEVEAE